MEKKKNQQLTDCKGRGRLYFSLVVIVIAALILFKVVSSTASHDGKSEKHFSETSINQMLLYTGWIFKEKDLTGPQREILKTILNDSAPKFQALKKRHEVLKRRFLNALGQEQVNTDELASIRRAYNQLADQTLGQLVDDIVKITEVLTYDQRKDLIKEARNKTHAKR